MHPFMKSNGEISPDLSQSGKSTFHVLGTQHLVTDHAFHWFCLLRISGLDWLSLLTLLQEDSIWLSFLGANPLPGFIIFPTLIFS